MSLDILVVGGGPAGLAAAIAARGKGFRVALADPGRPPIDKACGEGLMPDGVAALEELGIDLSLTDAVPFRGIRFVEHGDRPHGAGTGQTACATLGDNPQRVLRGAGGFACRGTARVCLSAQASFPSGAAIGIRRTSLHRALVERAERSGVEMLWGTAVTGIGPEGTTLDGRTYPCRWIIGADGERSRVRQWAGLDSATSPPRRFGFRRHYRVEPWTDFMELHWGDTFQIYITPVARGEVCIAVLSRDPHLRLPDALARMPELAARLRHAVPVSAERGAVSSSRRLAAVWRDRVALIGDASGSVDAITGQGLRLAFRQSLALADALETGDLARYGREHRRLARRAGMTAALMLLAGRSRGIRRRAMRALSAHPQIFERLLAAQADTISNTDFAGAGVALGWRMLTT